MKIDHAGAGLPPWRQRVLPVVMTLVRLLVAYLVAQGPVRLLLRHPSFVLAAYSRAWRWPMAGALLAGALLFVVPRSVMPGALLLGLGLVGFEYLFRMAGGPASSQLFVSLALITVLAVSARVTQHVQNRVYPPR